MKLDYIRNRGVELSNPFLFALVIAFEIEAKQRDTGAFECTTNVIGNLIAVWKHEKTLTIAGP